MLLGGWDVISNGKVRLPKLILMKLWLSFGVGCAMK